MSGAAERLSAEDQLAILELAARYWNAVDHGDLRGFAETFTEDGKLENFTGVTQGRDALAQWLLDFEAERLGNRHYTVNHLITKIDDNTARVWSYLVITSVAPPKRGTPRVAAVAEFEDRVVRVDGEWLFEQRTMTVLGV
ncbi:nuclear transport factor 2 family protein [Streptomyces sp. NPDC046805]|uniref:nuclear transport factor 2 family protein n=1 Tax=Streptomyces sp. NPDC046805 TaxID=3155134 RepID=UPI0033FB304C